EVEPNSSSMVSGAASPFGIAWSSWLGWTRSPRGLRSPPKRERRQPHSRDIAHARVVNSAPALAGCDRAPGRAIRRRRACGGEASVEALDAPERRQKIRIERQHELAHPVRLSASDLEALAGTRPLSPLRARVERKPPLLPIPRRQRGCQRESGRPSAELRLEPRDTAGHRGPSTSPRPRLRGRAPPVTARRASPAVRARRPTTIVLREDVSDAKLDVGERRA